MNIHDAHGFRVIVDYGHNPAAVEAMCTLVDRLAPEHAGKKVVVLAMPGDRRDEDIVAVAQRAAKSFDHFICRRDDGRRGRGEDEVPQLLRKTLIDSGVSEDRIEIVVAEQDAVNHALDMCLPGDLVLMLCDNITRTWKQVIYFGSGRPETLTKEATSEVALPVVDETAQTAGVPTVDDSWGRDNRGVYLQAED